MTESGQNPDKFGHRGVMGFDVRVKTCFPRGILGFQNPDQIRTFPDDAIFQAFPTFRLHRQAITHAVL